MVTEASATRSRPGALSLQAPSRSGSVSRLARGIAQMIAAAIIQFPTAWVAHADDADAAWEALRAGGHVALVRHALAPGSGDPFDFELGDCATQRNLDERGRIQARAIGAAFRDYGVAVSRVLTSRWCRCVETAELMDLAPVEPFALLDSLTHHRDTSLERTGQLRIWINGHGDSATVVMVTHNTNISALVGILPDSGETVVVRASDDGQLVVVGRIPPPPIE